MAKRPDDPSAPPPDDAGTPESQPHPLGEKQPPAESDSGIEFNPPAAGSVENSGISVIEWASLVEEPQPPSDPNLKAKLESASSAHLLPDEPAVMDEPLPEAIVELPTTVEPPSHVNLGASPPLTPSEEDFAVA